MESTRYGLRPRAHRKMRVSKERCDEDKENRGRKPLTRNTKSTFTHQRCGLHSAKSRNVIEPKIGIAPSTKPKATMLKVPNDTPSENRIEACGISEDLTFITRQINPNDFFDVPMETDSTSDGYEEDVLSYLKERENAITMGRVVTSLPVEKAHYKILVNWLVDVQVHLDLQNETLHIAVAMLDAYLHRKTISLHYLQLLGLSCLFIASKYEEIYVPSLDILCKLCADTYTEKDILTMERRILYTLDFKLFFPTAADFLGRYLTLASIEDERLVFMSNYLVDVTLPDFHYESPRKSLWAAAAFFLALLIRKNETRHESDAIDDQTLVARLETMSGYNEFTLTEIAKSILKSVSAIKDAKNKAVYYKYNEERYHFISEEISKYSATLLNI